MRINPNQPESTRINLHQPASNRINPHQPASTCINSHQPASNSINLHQPTSTHITHINLYQADSTCINRYQPLLTRINPNQPVSTCINLYQPVSTRINWYRSLCRFLLVATAYYCVCFCCQLGIMCVTLFFPLCISLHPPVCFSVTFPLPPLCVLPRPTSPSLPLLWGLHYASIFWIREQSEILCQWNMATPGNLWSKDSDNGSCKQRWKKGWSTGALLPEGTGQDHSCQKDLGQVYRTCWTNEE